MLAVLNILVCGLIAGCLVYKIMVMRRYAREMANTAATAILRRFLRANVIDLSVFLVFAINSVYRALTGFDAGEWEHVTAEAAILLRLVAVGFSCDATSYANRRCDADVTEIKSLLLRADSVLKG